MSYTNAINNIINLSDIYISLRIKESKSGQCEVISNMPEQYKSVYYQNKYNEIDDTFDFTELTPETILYPCSDRDYNSAYIQIMESHGYYNLVSFSLCNEKKMIACIVTLGRKVSDYQNEYQNIRTNLIDSIKIIIENFSKLSDLSDFDFSRISDLDS